MSPFFKRWTAYLPVLVVLCGVAAYYNSFQGVFLLDDHHNIVRNEGIRELTSVWRLLTQARRPVVAASLALNYSLGELKIWGYHAFNLSVHILAGLTLYGVVRRTLLNNFGFRISDFGLSPGRPSGNPQSAICDPQTAPWLALAVSLIWVVHPLTTQGVTYVIQRGESLMGLFYLLTLYCVIRGSAGAHGRLWYAGAVGACALGMGSKGVMVTAPVTVFLYDIIFLSRTAGQALRKRWGLYVGLAATWIILVQAGVARSVLFPPSTSSSYVGFGYQTVSPQTYLITQAEVILHYLRLSVWPHPLCLDYHWPAARNVSEVILPGTVVIGLLAVTCWMLLRRSWVGFVGGAFFIILAPTSSFIPIKDLAFEHRMYLPLAAVIVLCVVCVHGILGIAFRRVGSAPLRRWVTVGLVAVSVGALGAGTIRRNRDYHDKVVMWQDVLAQRPGHQRAHYNLGLALFDREQYATAAQQFRNALKFSPNYKQAHNNLGSCLQKMGRLDEAIEQFRLVVQSDPDHWRARFSLGSELGRRGQLAEAVVHLEACVRLNPDHAPGFYNLGNAYRDLKRLDQSVDAYRRAVQVDPLHVSAYNNMARVLRFQGRLEEAVESFQSALRADPTRSDIRQALESTKKAQGRLTIDD